MKSPIPKPIVANVTPMRPGLSVLICSSPKAGSGAGREGIAGLAGALTRVGVPVEVTTNIARVRERTDAGAVAQGCCPVVVTAGGDGTLALVAQNTPPSTVLVPMPLGTENLLSKHFGYSAHTEFLVDTLLHGRDHAIDAGLANGKLFLVMATCGFDAEVVRAMHLRRRGHINRFSYAWPILRTLGRYRFPSLDVQWITDGSPDSVPEDSPHHCCRWAMIFNLPRYAASLPIESAAREDDGLLDFCGLEYGSVISGVRYLGGIVARRHIHWQDVKRQAITGCRITSPARVSYQLDGDYAGRLPLEIRVLPKHITLRLPPSCPVK
ncbi:MAG: diacylglycerol/lipid kinase family protein [Planctomycetaceae bacterium]